MVSDSEPRYRLVDSNGNVVGTLYAKSGGTLAIQEGSSGSDNEIELQTDGTLQTDSLSTDNLSDGVAGNGNTITGIAGDTGEVEVFASLSYLPGTSTTVSATSFSELGGFNARRTVANDSTSLQNTQLVAMVSGRVENVSSQTTVRFASESTTETTLSSTGFFSTGFNSVTFGSFASTRVEAKVDTGDSDYSRLVLYLGREIL